MARFISRFILKGEVDIGRCQCANIANEGLRMQIGIAL
jgi:hypothetical protein